MYFYPFMQNTITFFRILLFTLALSFSLSAQKIQVGPYSLRLNGTQKEKNQWGPSEITYRIANDSLVFQVSEFQWDPKTNLGMAKGGEIPGEKLGHKNARLQIDEMQFQPANGTLRFISADWIEQEKALNGEGSLTLRRKDKYFPFEFKGTESTEMTGDVWSAEGKPVFKDLRKGLRDGALHFQKLGTMAAPLIWFLPDSSIVVPQGRWTSPLSENDSLFRGDVAGQWYPKNQTFHFKKNTGAKNRALFEDTFHEMRMSVDLGVLRVKEKRIDFYQISGRNQVPAWLESKDYYNDGRIQELQGLLNYSPMRILYRYLVENKAQAATIGDLAVLVNRRPEQIQSGFQSYVDAGYMQVVDDLYSFTALGRHYARVAYEKKDFDTFYAASMGENLSADSASISLDLVDKKLRIRGIQQVMISDSLKAEFIPYDEALTFQKGRDFNFLGEIKIGDYRFRGPNFAFKFNDFTAQFAQIDSITFIPKGQSKEFGGAFRYGSGSLILSPPGNKSGRFGVAEYPKLLIPKGMTAHFDEPWRAKGVYDSTYFFKVPSIALDSLTQKAPVFVGTFHSKGLLPPINTQLILKPDQSFGFTYTQKTPLKIYQNKANLSLSATLEMDKKGLHTAGSFAMEGFQSSMKEAFLYPDSLISVGSEGKLGEMANKKGPIASLPGHRFSWLPREDSLAIYPEKNSFALYANQLQLEGPVWMHKKQVFGKGDITLGDGKLKSELYYFQPATWKSKDASLAIGLKKPVFQAERISIEAAPGAVNLNFKPVEDAKAVLPIQGYKTAYTGAVWEQKNQKIKLQKPVLQILDSTSKAGPITAKSGVLDQVSEVISLEGVKEIEIGPAMVFPAKGLLAIAKGGQFKSLTGARATVNGHVLANINTVTANANRFTGTANYLLPVEGSDSLVIPMKNFDFLPEGIRAEARYIEKTPLKLTSHQEFKGDVYFLSEKPSLEFKGSIRPLLGTLKFKTAWIPFANSKGIVVNDELKDELGRSVTAGIFVNAANKLYPSFLGPMSNEDDPVLFKAAGEVTEASEVYSIKNAESQMHLSIPKKRVDTDGMVQLFTGNKLIRSFGKISMSIDTLIPRIESWLSLQFQVPVPILQKMGDRIVKYNLEEGLLTAAADEPADRDEYLKRVEPILGKKIPEATKARMDREHLALDKVDPEFASMINFSSVKWAWSPNLSAFYSIGDLPLINVGPVDVNATIKGFMEVVKKPNKEEFYAYWELSEDLWYYFAYFEGELGVYSSDNSFLAAVRESLKTQKKGGIKVVEAAAEEKNAFIKRFTSYYKPLIPVKKAPVKKEPTKTKPATKGKEKSGGF